MLIAMLLTETFERFYRRAGKPLIVSLVVSLYALNACMIFSSDYLVEFASYKYTVTDFLGGWTGAPSLNSYENITTACEVLVETHFENYFCQKPFLNYMNIVKEAQPDYLFIIERHLTFLPALNSTEAERAVLSKQAESRIDELSAAVKKKLEDQKGHVIGQKASTISTTIAHSVYYQQDRTLDEEQP
ncbi:unnamed protein product [Angiostrongylus costaricensis]|uniref:Sulfatase domain-containing protein n=1 Tax=Angiostrongylus costaricensis TaxID=334426 RepID=A0A0R3PDC0_ANGCS|nr:unnamed protein product [Angiostrongylus costaricensis]